MELSLTVGQATNQTLFCLSEVNRVNWVPHNDRLFSSSLKMNSQETANQLVTLEILKLQASIDQSNLRRAAELSMAEKFRRGADLFDEGIVWLRQIIKAQQPTLTDEQVDEELDRRRKIERQMEDSRRCCHSKDSLASG
jgi:hypothetical protein